MEATSATTDQVVLEARSLLQSVDYPEILLTETAPGLDNLEELPFETVRPEAYRLYSSGHT